MDENKIFNVPDDIKCMKFVSHGGEDDLTQEEINEVTEFVRFVKSKRKKEETLR